MLDVPSLHVYLSHSVDYPSLRCYALLRIFALRYRRKMAMLIFFTQNTTILFDVCEKEKFVRRRTYINEAVFEDSCHIRY